MAIFKDKQFEIVSVHTDCLLDN